MSNVPWQQAISQTLKRLQRPDTPGLSSRIALVGVGHELRGDDAAGVILARLMQPLAESNPSRLLVVNAGQAPENFTRVLRDFHPDLIVFVDAAQMNGAPGTIRWLAWQDTAGLSGSTHTLPIHVLASFLSADLGCEIGLLGIQPAGNVMDAPLSPAVQQAVTELADRLAMILLEQDQ